MRSCLLLVVVILQSLYSLSQTEKIKDYRYDVGTVYERVEASKSYFFTQSDSLLVVRETKKGVLVQQLEAYELVQLSAILFKDFQKKFKVEIVTKLGGAYCLIYSVEEENENTVLHYREIDFSKGKLLSPKVLCQLEKQFDYKIKTSPQKTKLLLELSQTVDDQEQKSFVVFDGFQKKNSAS